MLVFSHSARSGTRALRWLLTVASLGLTLVACAETSGPSAPDGGGGPPSGGEPQGRGRANPVQVRLTPDAPRPAASEATFWAVQGHETGVDIGYRSSARLGTDQPFLRFRVPAGTRLIDPTGRPLAEGDSVRIVVRVVPGQLAVQLAPSGLRFEGQEAARLTLSYRYGDIAGRPTGDLAIWYQPDGGGPWQEQRGRVDWDAKAIVADILHFSNYAVAY